MTTPEHCLAGAGRRLLLVLGCGWGLSQALCGRRDRRADIKAEVNRF